MTPKVREERIKDKEEDHERWKEQIQQRELHPRNDGSDENHNKTYQKMMDDLEKQIQELKDGRPSKKKKVKVEYWTPESKGEMDETDFDRPYLTVSVHKTITKRPTKDSIRMYWSIKDDRCEYLVEEKGYVVGVIESVVIGVVEVSGWKIIKEGDNEGRVEFEGELLSDHPSIDFTLKDRTVSGPIQYFNYPDDWKDEKES